MRLATRGLALAGLCAAMVLLLTLLSLPLPSGIGYLNLGDAGVFLCALLFRNARFGLQGRRAALWAGAAAGLGSALADLLLGFTVYMPISFVVKGLTALCCAGLLGVGGTAYIDTPASIRVTLPRTPFSGRRCLLAMLPAAPIVPLGYLCFELPLYGRLALANIPANALQTLLGVGLAYAAGLLVNKK